MSQALFPGWRPDPGGRGQLAALAGRLAEACPPTAASFKLRRPDQWHLTLCFIGHVGAGPATPKLHDALAAAARLIPPHAFTIRKITYWDGSGAVVALPHDCPALQALCDATRDAIRRCGIRPDKVTTQPHVTLAYLDRHMPVQPWLDEIDCSTEALRVDGFELLFNPGGRYEPLGEWALAGTGLPRVPQQGGLF